MAFAHKETRPVKTYGRLSPYPVQESDTDTRWKSVANGGQVESATGDDISFFSDLTLATQYAHDIERFDPATGEVIMWVNVDPAEGTYVMAWGDASIAAPTEDKAAVWGSNGYVLVAHCADNLATTTVKDASGTSDGLTVAHTTDFYHVDPGIIGDSFAFTGAANEYFYFSARYGGGSYMFMVEFTLDSYASRALVSRSNFGAFDYLLAVIGGYLYFDKKSIGGIGGLGSGGGITGTTHLDLGVAYVATCTFDATANIGRIYLGLAAEGETASLEAQGSLPHDGLGFPNVTAIGTTTSIAHMWDGTIDEVRFAYGIFEPGVIAPAPPILPYENPCSIKSPIFIAQLQDLEGTVTQGATRPMRNSATYLGGFTPGSLLDISPIVREASSFRDGTFPVQSCTITLADTRRRFRDAVDADDGDWVNHRLWLLLLSEAGRLLEVAPRPLFQGAVYHDPLASHLRYQVIANDVIGVNYSLHADEVMIPQTRIEDDFPEHGQTNLFGGGTIGVLGGPIIAGVVSDEDSNDWPPQQTAVQGVIKLIYGGMMTCLDSVSRHVGIVACHPCKSIINCYQGDDSHTVITWGTTAFAPGKSNWASKNPSGSALYTQINGRWWTVVFFNTGTIGDGFADDTLPIYANVQGFETIGDGTGTLITDLLLQYQHCLVNFLIPTPPWQMGAWLDPPAFPSYYGGEEIDRIDTDSFTTASAVASGYLTGGFIGGFVIGADGHQQALRDVIAQFNVQANVSLGWNASSQLFVCMLDRERASFLQGRRTISDRRDILRDPAFEAPFDRSLIANNTRYDYRMNYNTGAWDAINQLGSGPSFTKYNQSLLGEVEAYTLIRDDFTAGVVNQQRLDVRAFSRRTPAWGEGLCGLQREILSGWPLTHFNGEGPDGYVDAAMWLRSVTIDPKTCRTLFTAMAVDRLMGTSLNLGGAGSSLGGGSGPGSDPGPGGGGPAPGGGGPAPSPGGQPAPGPSLGGGTVFYVATTGSDDNPGTLGAPWRTLNFSVNRLVAGDTLLVRAGTYAEALINTLPSGTSWSSPVRIAAYPGETVWMQPTSGHWVIYFNGTPGYIEFDGINISGANIDDAAVFFDDRTGGAPHHIRFQNAEVAHRDNLSGGNTNAAILMAGHDNEFLNLTVHGIGGPYGFYVHGERNLIDGCNVHHTASAAIQVYHNGGVPDSNIVRNTFMHDISVSNQFGVDDGRMWGLIIYNANNTQAYNNVIYGINYVGATGSAVSVFGAGNKIWNNTVYNNTVEGIRVALGSTNTEIKNNIVYLNTGTSFIDDGSGTTASNNSTSGVDPLFTNAGAADFTLQAGSPCRNAGATIATVTTDIAGTARPQGGTYDIGAYERA